MHQCGKQFFLAGDDSKKFDKYSSELPEPPKLTNQLIKYGSGEPGVWSEQKEQQYRANRKICKEHTKGVVSSAAYTDCTLSAFIYDFINNQTTQQIRKELLDKYNDGRYLTVAELRYLTYTSQSLS